LNLIRHDGKMIVTVYSKYVSGNIERGKVIFASYDL